MRHDSDGLFSSHLEAGGQSEDPHSLGVCNSAAYGKGPSKGLGSWATASEANLGCASDDSLQPTLWLLRTSDKGEGSEIQLMCN